MLTFIVNPHSRTGRARGIWERTESILKKKGVTYCAYLTEYRGHATQLARELTQITNDDRGGKTIVVLGGDGTLNEVLNGIAVERNVTLGYIPTGSGNDLARSLGLSRNADSGLLEIIEQILHPSQYKLVDYGCLVTEGEGLPWRRFLVSCGIGYDASVCKAIIESKFKVFLDRLHLTKFGYVAMGIKELVKVRPQDGYLLIDGVKRVPLRKIMFVSAHIHPYEGGGFMFAPGADCQDGRLRVCAVSDMGRIKMIFVLLAGKFGKHGRMRGVHLYDCKEILIHLNSARTVHADGEILGAQTEISARCIKKQIHIIT